MSKKLILILILLVAFCGCDKGSDDEYYDYYVKCAKAEARLKIDNIYGFNADSNYTIRIHLLEEGKIPYYFFVEKDNQPIFGMSFYFEKDNLPEGVTAYKYKSGYLVSVIDPIAENIDKNELENYNKKDVGENINDMLALNEIKKVNKNEVDLSDENKTIILEDLPTVAQLCKSALTANADDRFEIKGFVRQFALKLNDKETEITIQQSDVLLCAFFQNDTIRYLISYDVESGERMSVVAIDENSPYYQPFCNYNPVMSVAIGEYPYNRNLLLSCHETSNDMILAQNSPLPVLTQKALAQIKTLAGSYDDLSILYTE